MRVAEVKSTRVVPLSSGHSNPNMFTSAILYVEFVHERRLLSFMVAVNFATAELATKLSVKFHNVV